MRTFIIRSALVVIFPFVVAAVFLCTFFREMRNAVWYARMEARAEIASFWDCWENLPNA